MANQKHLTLEMRTTIQELLKDGTSFKEIGKAIDKDPSTISKEVRAHIVRRRVGYSYVNYNACANRFTCEKKHVCSICTAEKNYKKCRSCAACNKHCPDFVQVTCPKLLKPPYVCNGCYQRLNSCTLEKRLYYADKAQGDYLNTLSESRSGISLSEEEIRYYDGIISPLIKQGQSPHHICVTNSDEIMISESTVYRLIDAGVLDARNIDLTRKVRFRPRKNPVHVKVDKACRIGRTYVEFEHYMDEHPDTPITELDSVEGKKGSKVLLTIHFVKTELMLAFLREHNDSKSVIDIFNRLYKTLGHDIFCDLFQLCLPDNGSEFSNPKAIEMNEQGVYRTRIFYCDPSAPYQKGSAERNHEFIRLFIPKGKDFADYTQKDISLMMDHINSYSRKSLGEKCPIEMFSFLYGENVLDLLGVHRIPSNSVTLNKSIFNKEVQA
ncbi:MAG: IS30 family transposase [Oribacterium sp.]|nr:IS30 family transposase [Oribacterium sp.]